MNAYEKRVAEQKHIQTRRRACRLLRTAQAHIGQQTYDVMLKVRADNVLRSLRLRNIDATEEVLEHLDELLKRPVLALQIHDHITKAHKHIEAERQEKFEEIKRNIDSLQLYERQDRARRLEREVNELKSEVMQHLNKLSETHNQLVSLERHNLQLEQKLESRPDIRLQTYNEEKTIAVSNAEKLVQIEYQLQQEKRVCKIASENVLRLQGANKKLEDEIAQLRVSAATTNQQLQSKDEQIKDMSVRTSELEEEARKLADDKITAARDAELTSLFNNERTAKEKLQADKSQLESEKALLQAEAAKVGELNKTCQEKDIEILQLRGGKDLLSKIVTTRDATIQELDTAITRYQSSNKDLKSQLEATVQKAEAALSRHKEDEQKIRTTTAVQIHNLRHEHDTRQTELNSRIKSLEGEVAANADELLLKDYKHRARVGDVEKERNDVRDLKSRLEIELNNDKALIAGQTDTIKNLTAKAQALVVDITKSTAEKNDLTARLEQYAAGSTDRAAELKAEQARVESLQAEVREMSNAKVRAEQEKVKLNQLILHHGYRASLEVRLNSGIDMNVMFDNNVTHAAAKLAAAFKNYPVTPTKPVELWLKASAGVGSLSLSHILGAVDNKLSLSDLAFLYDVTKTFANLVNPPPHLLLGVYALGYFLTCLATDSPKWQQIEGTLKTISYVSPDPLVRLIGTRFRDLSLPASVYDYRAALDSWLPIDNSILVSWIDGYVLVDALEMIWMDKKTLSVQVMAGAETFKINHDTQAIQPFVVAMTDLANLTRVVSDMKFAM